MVSVQNWPFFHVFILGNIGQENVFYNILERKNAFLGYKNEKFKKSKKWYFSKGVSPWFWSKNCQFLQLFMLVNIGKENVFYDILKGKNDCLGYKNETFKRLKKGDSPKRVRHRFLSTIGHFSIFLFLVFILDNIGQENVFYNIVERKHAFLDYNKKKFNKL